MRLKKHMSTSQPTIVIITPVCYQVKIFIFATLFRNNFKCLALELSMNISPLGIIVVFFFLTQWISGLTEGAYFNSPKRKSAP